MFKKIVAKTNLRYLAVGLLLTAVLAGPVLILKAHKKEQARKVPAPLSSAPLSSGGLSAEDYYPVPKTLGPDSAPVKIVEYSDFECPSCRHAEPVIKTLFQSYPGKIQLVYRHFPLQSHKGSPYAHQAAECMHIQGKFWPYHDMLYQKQEEWARLPFAPLEKLVQYAQACGANMDSFASCMSDAGVARGIYAEKEEGTKSQVTATPTFLVENERFVGPQEMLGRGQNAVRKILGLPPLPVQPVAVKANPEAATSAAQPPAPGKEEKP